MRENDNGDGNGYGAMTSLLVGTVIGAAVGAGVALLFAPRSGRETRKLLLQKAQSVREKARVALEHGKDAMRREVENVTQRADTPSAKSAQGPRLNA